MFTPLVEFSGPAQVRSAAGDSVGQPHRLVNKFRDNFETFGRPVMIERCGRGVRIAGFYRLIDS